MRIDVVTLFPEEFRGLTGLGVTGRGIEHGRLDLHVWNPDGDELVTFPKLGKRLDWVLVSREFSIISHEVLQDSVSDHQPVIVEVTLLDIKSQDTAQLSETITSEADL